MNRRSFLKGLLAAPLAAWGLLAKPETETYSIGCVGEGVMVGEFADGVWIPDTHSPKCLNWGDSTVDGQWVTIHHGDYTPLYKLDRETGSYVPDGGIRGLPKVE